MTHILIWIIVILAVFHVARKIYRELKEGKCSCCQNKHSCHAKKTQQCSSQSDNDDKN